MGEVKRINPCPHCKKPTKWEGNPWRPFCSERCKMIDLGKWAMGEYRIPGEKVSPSPPRGEAADEPSGGEGKKR